MLGFLILRRFAGPAGSRSPVSRSLRLTATCRRCSLALLDIDHFKTINDTWGHQTSDHVIRFVVSVISEVGAPPRFAVRFGGDEFAMIFSGEPADRVEQRLRDMIAEIAARQLKRRDTNEPRGDLTEHRPGETPTALMERPDQELYASKHTGSNRVAGAVPAAPPPRAASPTSGARDRVLRALRH
jgi:diguanylate cyclase